jgi:hypothetical protein
MSKALPAPVTEEDKIYEDPDDLRPEVPVDHKPKVRDDLKPEVPPDPPLVPPRNRIALEPSGKPNSSNSYENVYCEIVDKGKSEVRRSAENIMDRDRCYET